MRFKLLPLEPFWFRITAQATPQKTNLLEIDLILRCFSLLVLDVLRSFKRLFSNQFEQDLVL